MRTEIVDKTIQRKISISDTVKKKKTISTIILCYYVHHTPLDMYTCREELEKLRKIFDEVFSSFQLFNR